MAHFNFVIRYCTEASNQESKYAYRKIFFYKKSTDVKCTAPRQRVAVSVRNREIGYFCCQSSSYQIAYALYNINLLITFVRRRHAVVFLRSLLSETMRACLLTTIFSGRSVHSPVKDVVLS